MKVFKKLLIANRGEIAVRIIRSCRDMGLPVVAVYSDADRGALHVRMADEAYHIGGAAPEESYLNVERIMEVARRSGADALHPGYGFLSENPELAEACERAGITFVGPSAAAMRRVGEKTSARALAEAAGVPVVPGSAGGIGVGEGDGETDAEGEVGGSVEGLREMAARIGYPVLLKACAGGGGKGMRRVDSEERLADALRAAASESRTAFGDGCVYLEKLIERPRHVEVQLLADGAGNVVCLGERDCSIQRRHQKLIEETPSPAVTPELRSALFDAATRVARSAGYLNAGTVEFLLDGEGNFFFLEMNARLQVEHPVTEEALGIDLVREQLRIAAGGRVGGEDEGGSVLRRTDSEEAGSSLTSAASGTAPAPRYQEHSGEPLALDHGGPGGQGQRRRETPSWERGPLARKPAEGRQRSRPGGPAEPPAPTSERETGRQSRRPLRRNARQAGRAPGPTPGPGRARRPRSQD